MVPVLLLLVVGKCWSHRVGMQFQFYSSIQSLHQGCVNISHARYIYLLSLVLSPFPRLLLETAAAFKKATSIDLCASTLLLDWFHNVRVLKSRNLCFGFHHWLIEREMERKELHQLTKTQCLHKPQLLVTLTQSTAESKTVAKKLQISMTVRLQIRCWQSNNWIFARWRRQSPAFEKSKKTRWVSSHLRRD